MTTPSVAASGGLERLPEDPLERLKEDARRWLAFSVTGAYLFLLLLNVVLPVTLFVIFGHPKDFTLSDVKDLTTVMTGALTSLVGVLGFVVGYYFKALDAKKKD